MSRMEKTEAVRITSDTGRPFAACTNLPVRQEMLSREVMRGIVGGKIILPPDSPPPAVPFAGAVGPSAIKTILIGVTTGVTTYAITHPRETWNMFSSAVDKVGDIVSSSIHEMSFHTIGSCLGCQVHKNK